MVINCAAQLRAEVLLKLRGKCPDLSEEDASERVDRASEYFCAQTGRQHVPPGAFYLWIDMAVKIHDLMDAAASGGAASGAVTSVKRGDTTINYSDGAVAEAMADVYGRIAAYRVVRAR